MNDALIQAIANAIQAQEGYYPGSRAFRNNNPGNIWDGLSPGKTKRIWNQYPIDADGFLILPDYATGRALMEGQISLKINRGETLTQLINEWDSSDSTATRATYVANVSTATGLDPNAPLNTLGASPVNPIQPVKGKAKKTPPRPGLI
jgi:hypothetical protein